MGDTGALREPGRVDNLHRRVPLERVRQHRAAEQPSLPELHAERLERFLLTLGLDPLRDDARADVAAEGEERHHQRAACAVGVDGGDQRAVDLDELRPQLRDDSHAGVAGAGIVDGDAEAARSQFRRDPLQQGEVGYRLTFAEFEHDGGGVHPRLVHGLVEGGHSAAGRPACR